MARVKRGVTTHARHRKIINLAKGYRGRSSTNFRIADEGEGIELLKRDVVIHQHHGGPPGLAVPRLESHGAPFRETAVGLIEEVRVEHPRLVEGIELRGLRAELLLT